MRSYVQHNQETSAPPSTQLHQAQQCPPQQVQDPQLTFAFTVVHEFAKTIQACTALPGASAVISRDVALVASHLASGGTHSTIPTTNLPLHPGASTKATVNHPDYSILDQGLQGNRSTDTKHPTLPLAQSTAAAPTFMKCAGHGPGAFTAPVGAHQHANGVPDQRPSNGSRATSNETGAGASKTSSEGHGCKDVLAAQYALAVAMGLQHSSQVYNPAGVAIEAPVTPGLVDYGVFGMPDSMHVFSLQGHHYQQAFTAEDLMAADTLASLRSSSCTLLAPDRQESCALQVQPRAPLLTTQQAQYRGPARTMASSKPSAPKARRAQASKTSVEGGVKKRAAAKKRCNAPGHKGHSAHFASEVSCWPAETLEAVRTLWAQHGDALPVFCYNKDTAVRVDGLFKVIDGKKKILTSAGECVDPVEFERLGDRASSRNWQMSICITGLQVRPGSSTDVKLGHATRILGVHD